MGGKSKYEQGNQEILKRQLDQDTERTKLEAEYRRKQDELIQPFIDYNKAVIGDRTTLSAAVAPIVTRLSDATRKAQEDIFENTLPGGTRDVLTAEAARAGRTDIATAKNNIWQEASGKLANVGQGFGAFGLSQLGAGIRSLEGAGSTTRIGMEAEAARSPWRMLGSLVAAAGNVAGGKSLFSPQEGGGGKAKAPGSSPAGSSPAGGSSDIADIGWDI